MKKEPKFVPRDGQVDFTTVRWCPVINCVVKYKSKILVVERNKSLRLYPGYWNGISEFLDDRKSLKEKVEEELKEELGISKKHIVNITLGQIFDQEAPKYTKTWIVHPVLVEVDTNEVTFDWEVRRYEWLLPKEVMKLKLLPGFDQVIRSFFKV